MNARGRSRSSRPRSPHCRCSFHAVDEPDVHPRANQGCLPLGHGPQRVPGRAGVRLPARGRAARSNTRRASAGVARRRARRRTRKVPTRMWLAATRRQHRAGSVRSRVDRFALPRPPTPAWWDTQRGAWPRRSAPRAASVRRRPCRRRCRANGVPAGTLEGDIAPTSQAVRSARRRAGRGHRRAGARIRRNW